MLKCKDDFLSSSGLTGGSRIWIPRSRGCVAITLKWNIVILNEVKNLIESIPYKTEILRLKPQNDIATQPPSRGMTLVVIESNPLNYKITFQFNNSLTPISQE